MTSHMVSPKDNAQIAERLRLTRTAIGLLRDGETVPQGRFAEEAGLKPNAYNQYESGSNRPSLDAAIRLVERYQLTLDWIYLGDPSGLRYDVVEIIKRARATPSESS